MASKEKIRVKDLPLYPPDYEKSFTETYRAIEEEPLSLEKPVSEFRKAVISPIISFVDKQSDMLNDVSTKSQEFYNTVKPYIYDKDKAAISKGIVITIGGMGGFLWSLRRGGAIRRILYTGIGLGVTAAFCYPNETVDVFKTGYYHSQSAWQRFVEPPPPIAGPQKAFRKIDAAEKADSKEEKKEKTETKNDHDVNMLESDKPE